MSVKVIDISYCQKNVDFKKVKTAGISAVIIRTGYLGKTDTEFENHIRGATAAGLDIGVYTYIMSENTAQAKREARETIERIKRYRDAINYPVFCDMEDNKFYASKYKKKDRTDIINAFCAEIKKAGFYPALYINPAWLEQFTNKTDLSYDIWLAAWTGSPEKTTKYNYGQKMWQWGTEKIDGINGEVDSNICYADYPKIISAKENLKVFRLGYPAAVRARPKMSAAKLTVYPVGAKVSVAIGSEIKDGASGFTYIKIKRGSSYGWIVKSALGTAE